MSSQYIDLSHTISDGQITYKGLPAPIVCDFLSHEDSVGKYEEGTTFQIAKVDMVTNSGTYIDCPAHRYKDGKDTAGVGLEKFVDLPGVVVRAPYQERLAVDVNCFENIDVLGKAVLVHTRWAELWNTDAYFEKHPYLTKAAAEYLRDHGARLVGIDAYNIDDTSGNARPVHSILLGEEILIVEHLCNLDKVPDQGFYFSAVPPKVEGVGSFPVRAFVKLIQ
ncbi:MAG: cyclase family protein [Bacteroidota bacterium]